MRREGAVGEESENDGQESENDGQVSENDAVMQQVRWV